MERFHIMSGKPLTGRVTIGGAKNAAVAIMPAALLADEPCIIDNLPYIDDVICLSNILEEVGAKVKLSNRGVAQIDGTSLRIIRLPSIW